MNRLPRALGNLQQLVGIEVLVVQALHLLDEFGWRVAVVDLVQAALAIRVALSASLLIFLVLSYRLGWIGEQGLR